MKKYSLIRKWGDVDSRKPMKSFPLFIFHYVMALILSVLFGTISLISVKAMYQMPPTIYIGQPGTPTAIENFIKPDLACNWSGIGGQVFDLLGEPVSGLVIKVTGSLEGNPVLLLALTGGAFQLGPGGYLIEFTDHPFDSQGNLILELLDIAGQPISYKIPLTTLADCEKNLLIFNLVEISTENNIYMPLILK
jgi:hypothetical protein